MGCRLLFMGLRVGVYGAAVASIGGCCIIVHSSHLVHVHPVAQLEKSHVVLVYASILRCSAMPSRLHN